eukprot:g1792.t1
MLIIIFNIFYFDHKSTVTDDWFRMKGDLRNPQLNLANAEAKLRESQENSERLKHALSAVTHELNEERRSRLRNIRHELQELDQVSNSLRVPTAPSVLPDLADVDTRDQKLRVQELEQSLKPSSSSSQTVIQIESNTAATRDESESLQQQNRRLKELVNSQMQLMDTLKNDLASSYAENRSLRLSKFAEAISDESMLQRVSTSNAVYASKGFQVRMKECGSHETNNKIISKTKHKRLRTNSNTHGGVMEAYNHQGNNKNERTTERLPIKTKITILSQSALDDSDCKESKKTDVSLMPMEQRRDDMGKDKDREEQLGKYEGGENLDSYGSLVASENDDSDQDGDSDQDRDSDQGGDSDAGSDDAQKRYNDDVNEVKAGEMNLGLLANEADSGSDSDVSSDDNTSPSNEMTQEESEEI